MNKQENRKPTLKVTANEKKTEVEVNIIDAKLAEVGFLIIQAIRWIAEKDQIPPMVRKSVLEVIQETIQDFTDRLDETIDETDIFDILKQFAGGFEDEAKQRN